MNVMVSLSNTPMAHPPRSNPFLRSSSDAPPFPCITPSTVTCVMVVSFMGSSFSRGGLSRLIAPRRRSHRPPDPLGSELDHAPDAVLRLHQLEPAVHVLEPDRVRHERRDVDLTRERALDELGHLVTALDAAE